MEEHPNPMSSVPRCEAIVSTVCTERYTSEIFRKKYANVLRWTPQLGWLLFDGKIWKRDVSNRVVEMCGALSQYFREKAARYRDEKIATSMFRWAKNCCETEHGIRAVLRLSESHFFADQEIFDSHEWLLNMANVAVDLRNPFEPFGHDPSAYSTKIIDCDYEPSAPRATWMQFLNRVVPDPEVSAFIKRAVGYSLSGSQCEQVFFVLYGEGCNGKSSLLDTLLTVIGSDYAAQADPRTFLVSRADVIRTDLARLRGVRFLSSVKPSEGGRLDDSLIKAVTGGDAITVRHLYKEEFQFHPEFKLWLATNHCPSISDTSVGMWRRVRLIPLDVQITEEERDPDLKEKLLQEREGIMQWALEGAAEYQRLGLAAPSSIRAATSRYREREDVVGDFLRRYCETASDANLQVKSLYRAFAQENDARVYTPNYFGRRLTEKVESGQLPGVRIVTNRGTRCLKGLRLLSSDNYGSEPSN
jgi:putative DNA primase/helicase